MGSILAKALPYSLLHHETIAFFLRANSTLYQSLSKSYRLKFQFFDLTQSLSSHFALLNRIQVSILSAPATVLFELAQAQNQGLIKIQPHTLFSVAEVLEPEQQLFIESVFQVPVKQIYQCTEGFLGITNDNGAIQLNEEQLIIEKEWLDTQRFVPIITDLKRISQPIIRYRLDDVLIAAPQSTCPFTEIASIEGREGDICIGINQSTHHDTPIFADIIRQAMVRAPIKIQDYSIKQLSKKHFEIACLPLLEKTAQYLLENHLNQLFIQQNCYCPIWHWTTIKPSSSAEKRRRIRCQLT